MYGWKDKNLYILLSIKYFGVIMSQYGSLAKLVRQVTATH